jgi:penicillin V acylase-like amidase (Ntn superfamily)
MCTRFLWNTNELAVLAGRTMDWPESTQPRLTVFPRGRERRGGILGGQSLGDSNPLNWTSRYGSVVVTLYGIGTADGVNEAGLAAHTLYLTATDFGERDEQKPGVQAALMAQYLLDCAGSVDEAVALLEVIQPVMVEAHGRQATVHFAVEDASGDSAIIEYLDGRLVIHHGRQFTLMTNDPSYDEQLALLAGKDFSAPSSDMPLPGNVNPRDRFQRAAYYGALLPEPANEREAAAGVMAIVRNVSVPFGAPYRDFGIYNTEYRTVADLTNKRYFFELTNSPSLIWTDLGKLDFAAGASTLTLDPDDVTLAGEVSDHYNAAELAF